MTNGKTQISDHKPDASDLSVVIPFRFDTPERLENLRAVVQHLLATMAGIEVILIEDGPALTAEDMADLPGVHYIGRQSDGPFHKTRILNEGIEGLSARAYGASYDTDALIYPTAFASALDLLRGGAGIVLPYNGMFFDIRNTARQALLKNPDLSQHRPEVVLAEGKAQKKQLVCINRNSVGGVVLFNRAAFAKAGGYHESFVAWGFEDAEIAERMAKFGHKVARVDGYPLMHLAHPRAGSGGGKWYKRSRHNVGYFKRMARMSREEIEALVASGALRGDMPKPAPVSQRLVAWLRGLFGAR